MQFFEQHTQKWKCRIKITSKIKKLTDKKCDFCFKSPPIYPTFWHFFQNIFSRHFKFWQCYSQYLIMMLYSSDNELRWLSSPSYCMKKNRVFEVARSIFVMQGRFLWKLHWIIEKMTENGIWLCQLPNQFSQKVW